MGKQLLEVVMQILQLAESKTTSEIMAIIISFHISHRIDY